LRVFVQVNGPAHHRLRSERKIWKPFSRAQRLRSLGARKRFQTKVPTTAAANLIILRCVRVTAASVGFDGVLAPSAVKAARQRMVNNMVLSFIRMNPRPIRNFFQEMCRATSQPEKKASLSRCLQAQTRCLEVGNSAGCERWVAPVNQFRISIFAFIPVSPLRFAISFRQFEMGQRMRWAEKGQGLMHTQHEPLPYLRNHWSGYRSHEDGHPCQPTQIEGGFEPLLGDPNPRLGGGSFGGMCLAGGELRSLRFHADESESARNFLQTI
jgi:hypothetical protein